MSNSSSPSSQSSDIESPACGLPAAGPLSPTTTTIAMSLSPSSLQPIDFDDFSRGSAATADRAVSGRRHTHLQQRGGEADATEDVREHSALSTRVSARGGFVDSDADTITAPTSPDSDDSDFVVSPDLATAASSPQVGEGKARRADAQRADRKQQQFSTCWSTTTLANGGIVPITEDDVHRAFEGERTLEDGEGRRSRVEICSKMFFLVKRRARKFRSRFNCKRFLLRNFPLVQTVGTYKRSYFTADMFGGLSEGIMHVPMGMSYALLASVPPEYGLYNSLVYPFVYLFFGTARQASVGVSAIEALLCAEAVDALLGPEAKGAERVHATIALSLVIGISMLIMRLFAMGIIANFLADPVLSGFSTASAFLIGTSQLKNVFGIDTPSVGLPKTWWYIVSHLNETNWRAFFIACVASSFLALVKVLNSRFFRKFPLPGQIFVVVVSTLAVYLLDWNSAPYNVSVVGAIPRGLPTFAVPEFDDAIFWGLVKEGAVLAVMFFIIHISISKSIARNRSYKIDADQELSALSACNIVGSFFQCFPNATSLSRSSVVNSIGSKTTLHNVPAVLVVILTLTVLTPLLFYLPHCALAAIVLVGVAGMVDFQEAMRLFSLMAPDFLLWLVSFSATVLLGAMEGIIVSVVLSLLWLVWKSSRPNTAVLGSLPETTIYRNVKRFPMAVEPPGVKIFRFDASLNFSNSEYFESKISAFRANDSGLYVVVIDGSSINDLDVTAIRMLRRLVTKFQEQGVILVFANWKGPMRDFLERAHFYDTVPPERCFLSLHDAVVWAEAYVEQLLASRGDESSPELDIVCIGYDHQRPPLVTPAEFATAAVAPTREDLSAVSAASVGLRVPPLDMPFGVSSRPETTSSSLNTGGRVDAIEIASVVKVEGTATTAEEQRPSVPRRLPPRLPLHSMLRPPTADTPMAASALQHRGHSALDPGSARARQTRDLDWLGMTPRPRHSARNRNGDKSYAHAAGGADSARDGDATRRRANFSAMYRARLLLRAVIEPHPPSPPLTPPAPLDRIGRALDISSANLGLTCRRANQSSGGLVQSSPFASNPPSVAVGMPNTPQSRLRRPMSAHSNIGLGPLVLDGPQFEWDGLSARLPYVRVIEEVTELGEQRRWAVATTNNSGFQQLIVDSTAGIAYSNPKDVAAWGQMERRQRTLGDQGRI